MSVMQIIEAVNEQIFTASNIHIWQNVVFNLKFNVLSLGANYIFTKVRIVMFGENMESVQYNIGDNNLHLGFEI